MNQLVKWAVAKWKTFLLIQTQIHTKNTYTQILNHFINFKSEFFGQNSVVLSVEYYLKSLQLFWLDLLPFFEINAIEHRVLIFLFSKRMFFFSLFFSIQLKKRKFLINFDLVHQLNSKTQWSALPKTIKYRNFTSIFVDSGSLYKERREKNRIMISRHKPLHENMKNMEFWKQ